VPVEGIEVTKPPWPFWWMFTLENWFGLSAILWGSGILFALLVLLPFLDRGPRRPWRQRPVVMVVTVAVIAALVVLSALLAVTSVETHL
jgi:ubiquinol-cytochrome c reductase cytochrome b subunit